MEIKRLQNIEQARQRQEAALIAAREKYLEEKRLVKIKNTILNNAVVLK